jgi:glycine cleavage system transcriptional repressor
MERTLVVTVVGDDRPGIVAGVTEALFELGCNLEDVSSTILSGHFTMMLLLHATEGTSVPATEAALAPVAERLHLLVRVGEVGERHVAIAAPTHVVSVYGADRPGIVFHVARSLADGGVNITDLRSRVLDAEGDAAYVLMMEVAAGDTDLDRHLDDLRREMDVEISINPLESELL